jgi:hypothetical protein
MTDQTPPADQLGEHVDRLTMALAGVQLEATAEALADALMVVALSAAEAVSDRHGIAKLLLRLAERYLAGAQPAAEPGPPSPQTMHAAFDAAVRLLADDSGGQLDAVREGMFSYVVGWMAKAESDQAAAGRLYAAADQMATRGSGRKPN